MRLPSVAGRLSMLVDPASQVARIEEDVATRQANVRDVAAIGQAAQSRGLHPQQP